MLPPHPFPNAVVFDMDGLMLDTERLYRVAWRAAGRDQGMELTDALFERMVGRDRRNAIGLMREAFGPAFDERAFEERAIHHWREAMGPGGPPHKPGLLPLLDHLRSRGLPLAVATSTDACRAEPKLEQARIRSYFSAVVTGDQVARGKPAPDIYLRAAAALRVPPSCALALEDSHAGVRAAHAAGLPVILVPDLLPATPEVRALASAVCDDLHAVLRLLCPPAAPGESPRAAG